MTAPAKASTAEASPVAPAVRCENLVHVYGTPGNEVAAALGRTITIRDGRVGAAGHGGREYMVVGKDGTVTLPPDLLDEFPPGSLATASRADGGVLLRRVDPGTIGAEEKK